MTSAARCLPPTARRLTAAISWSRPTNANSQVNPQITALANGGFAVTWQSGDNGRYGDIRGQVFAADGTPVDGSDFLVSTANASDQGDPQITALANGGFAVTWHSIDNGANFDIRGQVFAADGTPIDGSDFLVSTANASDQFSPQITALANGGFAVTWQSADNGTDNDIRGQVFAADGTPIDGSDFLVSTTNTSRPADPQITALANGGFAVTWQSVDNGANYDIRGQVFAADGTPIDGSDFLVSTANANEQTNPQITALANGGFAVTWQSLDNGANYDIRGQVFAADGTPIDGSDFLVSTANANDQINPQITALADGGFVVTWESGDNGSNADIRGRVFAADGTPIDGSDFLVSTTNANNQINPQITALPDGGFAVTWQSRDNGTNFDIRGRVFDQYGVENAITFDGGAGDDVFRSGAGNDIFNGGADNDTAYYRIGDGRDTVDGGAGDRPAEHHRLERGRNLHRQPDHAVGRRSCRHQYRGRQWRVVGGAGERHQLRSRDRRCRGHRHRYRRRQRYGHRLRLLNGTGPRAIDHHRRYRRRQRHARPDEPRLRASCGGRRRRRHRHGALRFRPFERDLGHGDLRYRRRHGHRRGHHPQ